VTAPRIGVLALQGDVREHLAALAACGAESMPVRRPAELAGLQGIVLPGGESTTIDKLARVFELRDPLVDALADGLPAYGSCAGAEADRSGSGATGLSPAQRAWTSSRS
jgi:5'-phosphate synthase pdxT subunit